MKTSSFLAAACLGALLAFTPRAQAVVYDLSTTGTVVVATATGNAIFTTDETQTAGTGAVDPFLTIQANGTEQGYNTSNGVLDTKRVPQYTHDVKLSELVKVTINGVEYYSFLLDINEQNSASGAKISLDAMKIYTSPVGGQTTTNIDSLGTKVFDFDSLADNYIKYDDLNSGSGQHDIAFFIPVAGFVGSSPDDFVYLYLKFGGNSSPGFDGSADGGFEEVRVGDAQPVPEVAAFFPLAGVLGLAIGAQHFRRRKTTAAV
jgi:hypothetical protein